MTRETKIGLLVGLAFIIVIGILLSEHVSSTNEPQQAAWGGAGANVRDGVTTPADNDGPPVTIVGAGGNDARTDTARRPIPTREDLGAGAGPVAFAGAGRGDAKVAPVILPPAAAGISGRSTFGATVGSDRSPVSPGSPPEAAALVPNPVDPPAARSPRGVRELLLSHPEDLTPVTRGAAGGAPRPESGRPGPAGLSGERYVAVAGDNLSHMAAHLLGDNSKANRELLLRANPSLQAEGNPVIAGRTYVIPGVTARSAKPASAAGPAVEPEAPRGSRTGAFRWYTVKGNDNLWRIAEGQLGSGNAWTQIRDMNKDVLKGGETVHPNMRLRLPARSAFAGAE